MSCDHSIPKRICLNLFYYFMILFECNNVVILNLIIFGINYNQYVDSHKSHNITWGYQLSVVIHHSQSVTSNHEECTKEYSLSFYLTFGVREYSLVFTISSSCNRRSGGASKAKQHTVQCNRIYPRQHYGSFQ
jgi:hypothetical protein